MLAASTISDSNAQGIEMNFRATVESYCKLFQSDNALHRKRYNEMKLNDQIEYRRAQKLDFGGYLACNFKCF